MNNEWIIDVLNDLRTFAKCNNLPGITDQLDDTIHVAALELSASKGGSSAEVGSHVGQTRNTHRVYAASDNA